MNSLDRTPGRPRKIDEAKRREICALIAVGCGIEAAARYVGCSAATVRRELDRDEDFRRAFASAELTCRIEPLRALRAAAATHWRAAAWLLERTHPERFARRAPVAAAGDADQRVLDDLEAWKDDPLALLESLDRKSA
jgi:hypothetical protein